MTTIKTICEIEPLPTDLQLTVLRKVREDLIEYVEYSIPRFLCINIESVLLKELEEYKLPLKLYSKEVAKCFMKLNPATDIILGELSDEISLIMLLRLIDNSVSREQLLTLLIPSFNRSNIQTHSSREFIINANIWFGFDEYIVSKTYIPREFGDERLYNLFANKRNYHRFIFICKLIEELETSKV